MRVAFKLSAKNGAMYQWRLDNKYKTQMAASQATGIPYYVWNAAERMDFSALCPSHIAKLSEATGLLPDEICPTEMMRKAFKFAPIVRMCEVPAAQLLSIQDHSLRLLKAPTEIDPADAENMQAALEKVLATLTFREREILKAREGLFGENVHTLEEVGKKFNITRQRVREIQAKAMCKLQHPVRKKLLAGYLNGEK